MFSSYSNVVVWKMLVHNKARLALSLCGIAFSTLVLFMGIGFFNGLNDSQASLATILKADLVMMNSKTRSLNSFRRMDRTRLYQALAFDEIVQVIPIYEGQTKLNNPQTGMSKTIFYLAFPVDSDPFDIPGIDVHREKLKQQGTVLFDALSRKIYGSITEGMEVEIAEVKHRMVGTVELGPNFAKNGYILMSDTTLFAGRSRSTPDQISFGLIKTSPGTDIPALKERLQETLPDDFKVMTPMELRNQEVAYTTRATPVGALLGIGLIVGFAIGVIISYQILFNEVTDHMPQFATLKAVGFSKWFLISVVLKEALLLSVLGFFPGFLGGYLLYSVIEHYTKIVMFLTSYRILTIFILTVVMCNIAGVIAVKKVLSADPAELF
jgi:putative ABC transport system permease protein